MNPKGSMDHPLARQLCILALAVACRAQDVRPVASWAASRVYVAASDRAFVYDGRFDMADPAAPVDIWESSRISVDFQAATLALRFGRSTGENFFNLKVDGRSAVISASPGEGSTVPWTETLGPGLHHMVLVKRSEASAGTAVFRGVELSAGGWARRPEEPRTRMRILFFGDSVGAGACAEDGAKDQWESRRTHDATVSFMALTAGAFGADFQNISVSGIGIVTGYVDIAFGEVWDRLYPARGSARADLAAWPPDVVVINLGDNDASYPHDHGLAFPGSFAERYVDLYSAVRGAYPRAEIVSVRGGMTQGSTDPTLGAAWADAVGRIEVRDPKTCHFAFSHWTDLHPRVEDHRKLADELIAWLRTQPFMAAATNR